MKDLFIKNKRYVYIALGAVALWIAYTQLFAAGAPFASILSGGAGTLSQEKSDQILAEQNQLASQLDFMNGIRFDTTFFDSPLFASLIDFSQPLPEEQVGRPNPFAPVSGGVVSTTTSQ